jgi:hypothetical protein
MFMRVTHPQIFSAWPKPITVPRKRDGSDRYYGTVREHHRNCEFSEGIRHPNPTPQAIESVFDSLASDPNRPESRLNITRATLRSEISSILVLWSADKDFMDRIHERCLTPFNAKINDEHAPEIDVEEARGIAATCVCENISIVRKLNGGKFPNDEFRRLWEQFGCTRNRATSTKATRGGWRSAEARGLLLLESDLEANSGPSSRAGIARTASGLLLSVGDGLHRACPSGFEANRVPWALALVTQLPALHDA